MDSLLAVALWTLVMLVLELEMVTHHFSPWLYGRLSC